MIEIKPARGRVTISFSLEELDTLVLGMSIAAELEHKKYSDIAVAAQEFKSLQELYGRVPLKPQNPRVVRLEKFGCDARTVEGRYQTRPLDADGKSMPGEEWVYVDQDHDDKAFTAALIEAFK